MQAKALAATLTARRRARVARSGLVANARCCGACHVSIATRRTLVSANSREYLDGVRFTVLLTKFPWSSPPVQVLPTPPATNYGVAARRPLFHSKIMNPFRHLCKCLCLSRFSPTRYTNCVGAQRVCEVPHGARHDRPRAHSTVGVRVNPYIGKGRGGTSLRSHHHPRCPGAAGFPPGASVAFGRTPSTPPALPAPTHRLRRRVPVAQSLRGGSGGPFARRPTLLAPYPAAPLLGGLPKKNKKETHPSFSTS